MRTCIGCRQRRPCSELVRVVRNADGSLQVGRALAGRGAWLCPDRTCFDTATKRRAWTRALRGQISQKATDDLSARWD